MSTVFYHDDVALNDRLGKIVDEVRRPERVASVQAVEQLMVRYQRVRDAAEGEWALKMKQLVGVKDFEEEVQQVRIEKVLGAYLYWSSSSSPKVLLWIEKETTGNLAARSSIGHSLASSTELLRETETFQHSFYSAWYLSARGSFYVNCSSTTTR